jgi:hypothetical protein
VQKKGMVLVLGNIDSDDQVAARPTDLAAEFAKPFEACNILFLQQILIGVKI